MMILDLTMLKRDQGHHVSTQSQVPGETQPEPHKRERDRKVRSYRPTGRNKKGGVRKSDPSLRPTVRGHPGQSFIARRGNVLYCRACSTEVFRS